jgi:hypothetical protein
MLQQAARVTWKPQFATSSSNPINVGRANALTYRVLDFKAEGHPKAEGRRDLDPVMGDE